VVPRCPSCSPSHEHTQKKTTAGVQQQQQQQQQQHNNLVEFTKRWPSSRMSHSGKCSSQLATRKIDKQIRMGNWESRGMQLNAGKSGNIKKLFKNRVMTACQQ
jgi:hypothetical protein